MHKSIAYLLFIGFALMPPLLFGQAHSNETRGPVLELHSTLEVASSFNRTWPNLLLGFTYQDTFLTAFAEAGAIGDGLYDATADEGYFGNHYFTFENIGMQFDLPPLTIRIGEIEQYDVVESPYSLFISSLGHTTMLAEMSYERNFLFYRSRWIGLPSEPSPEWVEDTLYGDPEEPYHGSSMEYTEGWQQDRGANYKVFGLRFDPVRFGLLDVAIYPSRSFDLPYFALPFPSWFIQYLSRPKGEPAQIWYNDNAILGLFLEYEDDRSYGYAQLLVDDLVLNRYFKPEGNMLPDKLGWSLGGRREFSFGALRFYHAGATKYTFQAVGPDQNYEYTFFRIPEYNNDESRYIPLEENYVGYRNGENNIAFYLGYDHTLFPGTPFQLFLDISTELVISGSKSPNNPWHRYPEGPDDTKLLDGSTLEYAWGTELSLVKGVGLFDLFIKLEGDYFWNKLVKVNFPLDEAYNHESIYVPQEGNNHFEPLVSIGASLSYTLLGGE